MKLSFIEPINMVRFVTSLQGPWL